MRIAGFVLVCFAACDGSSAPSDAVEGLIVSVTSETVELDADGRHHTFVNDDPTVTIDHLRVHERDRLPVRIEWKEMNGRRVAKRIVDVPAG